MRSRWFLMLLLAPAVGCGSSTTTGGENGHLAAPPPNDRQLLRGDWKIVESSRTGDGKQRDLDTTVQFAGEMMTFTHKDGKPGEQSRYSVSASTSPRQIDLVQLDAEGKPKAKKQMPKGPEVEAVTPGIYELDGDTLKLAIAWTTNLDKRPTSFDAPAGSETVVYRLERIR